MDQNLKKARYNTCQKKRPLNKHKAEYKKQYRKFVLKNELLFCLVQVHSPSLGGNID